MYHGRLAGGVQSAPAGSHGPVSHSNTRACQLGHAAAYFHCHPNRQAAHPDPYAFTLSHPDYGFTHIYIGTDQPSHLNRDTVPLTTASG